MYITKSELEWHAICIKKHLLRRLDRAGDIYKEVVIVSVPTRNIEFEAIMPVRAWETLEPNQILSRCLYQ